ncbi:tRNA lysidine(34) synthetase TilS [Bacillus sp. 03113]|uniref:tRNA lysidine(34) synthetase TilS n=1 Tax=Bacillus sp. 03113 TaxID=2578211 RepID=UPI0011446554|nr:tRNA lysidine(34) synthetase TilS [Bacillus sp. 03113]
MLESKVEAFLKKSGYTLQNSRLLIGVSGGPDSLALLHFLWTKKEKWNLQIVAAHVDHMFRGEESLNEARFVQQFCENRNISFAFKQINVPEYIKQSGENSQVAARVCRYQFFKEVLETRRLDFLVLGHHGDDQVETILMRLTRGSTGKARAGIPFIRPFSQGKLIRPFLCLTKDEIEKYCADHHLDPRRDPSNEKDAYSRNRFRKYVIPFLKKENNQIHEHFQRFSEEIEQDEAYLMELAAQEMNKVMKQKEDSEITIDLDAFQVMPMPLQRRGIQLILNYLYKDAHVSLSALHIDSIFKMINSSRPSGLLDFPNGLNFIRSYRECHFRFYQREIQPFSFELYEPGEILLPNGASITFKYVQDKTGVQTNESLLLNRHEICFPIIVRSRKTGDRMSLKGMSGTKKIKDIFIDHKIPLQERESWPIVTDCKDRILWVPELKKSNEGLTSSLETSYIQLIYKRQ